MAPDLDDLIITLLRDNGQMPNVEIARRLDVSEASVRARLARLIESQAIRIGIVADLDALGYTVVSMVRMVVNPRYATPLLERLSALDDVSYVANTTGRFNVFTYIRARSAAEMTAFLDAHFCGAEGVIEIEVRQVADAAKYNFDEVVIRGDTPRAMP